MPMSNGWTAYFAPVQTRVVNADGKLAARLEWDEAENSWPSTRISGGSSTWATSQRSQQRFLLR
jgi:hypothetical protein